MSCEKCEEIKKRREEDRKVFFALGRLLGFVFEFIQAIVFLLVGVVTIGAGFFVWAYFISKDSEIVGRFFGLMTIVAGAYMILVGAGGIIRRMAKR